MTKASKVLLAFFWIAFAAFLLASIPHVAWFFSVYEPHNADGSLDMQYWFVSYAIAISIDITTFLLSMTVAGMAKQHKKTSLIVSVWLFILLLAVLSWFINGKYALHFAEPGVIEASPVTLSLFGWGNWHITDVNPLIASCFQVLAVAYTWIADKIGAGEVAKTADQLEQEAKEAERIAKAKAKIAAVKQASTVQGAAGLFDTGAAIFGHAKSRLVKPKKGDENSLVSDPETTGEKGAIAPEKKERNTGPLVQETLGENDEKAEENFGENDKETGEESGKKLAIPSDLIPLFARYPQAASLLSKRGTTVSVEDVATVFEITPTLVRNRVKDKKIRKTKNAEIVYKDSVISWAKSEMLPRGKGKVIRLETARLSQEQIEEDQPEQMHG